MEELSSKKLYNYLMDISLIEVGLKYNLTLVIDIENARALLLYNNNDEFCNYLINNDLVITKCNHLIERPDVAIYSMIRCIYKNYFDDKYCSYIKFPFIRFLIYREIIGYDGLFILPQKLDIKSYEETDDNINHQPYLGTLYNYLINEEIPFEIVEHLNLHFNKNGKVLLYYKSNIKIGDYIIKDASNSYSDIDDNDQTFIIEIIDFIQKTNFYYKNNSIMSIPMLLHTAEKFNLRNSKKIKQLSFINKIKNIFSK